MVASVIDPMDASVVDLAVASTSDPTVACAINATVTSVIDTGAVAEKVSRISNSTVPAIALAENKERRIDLDMEKLHDVVRRLASGPVMPSDYAGLKPRGPVEGGC